MTEQVSRTIDKILARGERVELIPGPNGEVKVLRVRRETVPVGKGAATVAKNDYFVVVYRILTYLYQCFMAGEKPDAELFGPEALGINNGYWANVMESIYNEGYITGIAMASRLGAAPGLSC